MILAHSDAPVGSVDRLPFYHPSDFIGPDSACLCRNTAPLVAFAFALLARGVPCHIVGKDIQVGLEKLIDKGGSDYQIEAWRRQILQHGQAQAGKLIKKGKREQAANYEDKVTALLVIARNCKTKEDVKLKLAAIFKDGTGLTLSTIHKAKGLEWTTVFLLDWNLLPSPYAESEATQTQERNLQYIAVTRAKLNLKFINTGNWKV